MPIPIDAELVSAGEGACISSRSWDGVASGTARVAVDAGESIVDFDVSVADPSSSSSSTWTWAGAFFIAAGAGAPVKSSANSSGEVFSVSLLEYIDRDALPSSKK